MEDNIIIRNLLIQSEDDRLEFKSDINLEVCAKVITSFINTKGGDLLIGVNDDKSFANITITEEDEHKLLNYLIKEIRPAAPITSRIETYKKKNFILISVWEGANKPYYFKNKVFIRQGAKTIERKNAVSALLNETLYTEQRWERQPVLGAIIDDLDLDEVKKSMEAYNQYSENEKFNDPKQFLLSRGLILNGNITNACMVLFGKNPTQFIPQSIIKFVVHPGTTAGDSFKENKIYNGNLFSNFRKIIDDFDVFIGKENVIEGFSRDTKRFYPEKALREGLLNAIVHRDYGTGQSFLTIELFSDRLVIRNYGGLQNNMTVRDLSNDHNSILRNPDIAQLCFYNHLIEMLGTGTLRMIRNCKEKGFSIPQWKNTNNILELTFPGIGHRFDGVNEGVIKGILEGVNINVEGVNEGVLSELQYLYKTINDNESKNTSEFSAMINKSLATTERYLKILKEQGLIEFRGAPKTGGYYIKNPNHITSNIDQQNEEANEGVNKGVNEGVNVNIDGVNEGVLSELQFLYKTITENEGKKTSELSAMINKSGATTERYLKILKEQALIEFRGAPKTGGYYVLKSNKITHNK